MSHEQTPLNVFSPFPKIPRLRRDGIVVTEKVDGTNAQVVIAPVEAESTIPGQPSHPVARVVTETGAFWVSAGSRNRWITPEADNFGFAAWVRENATDLCTLGPGRHYGEWAGRGIGRNYGLTERRFYLFNVDHWRDGRSPRPNCCHVVPILYEGGFTTADIDAAFDRLGAEGSVIAPGFMKPEGIVTLHRASKTLLKRTFEHDDFGKEAAACADSSASPSAS